MFGKASVILFKPQLDFNIGSTARVMMNFGLDDLRVVCPRGGMISSESLAVSRKAFSLLYDCSVYDCFPDSIKDLDYVYCISCRTRSLNKKTILPCDMDLGYENIGFVFGPENSGLTNVELSYANKIVEIDTSDKFKSMNLAQAVCIICYEINSKIKSKGCAKKNGIELYKKERMLFLLEFLEKELEDLNFFQEKNKKKGMLNNIRSMFFNMEISNQELQTMIGILKCLIKGGGKQNNDCK